MVNGLSITKMKRQRKKETTKMVNDMVNGLTIMKKDR